MLKYDNIYDREWAIIKIDLPVDIKNRYDYDQKYNEAHFELVNWCNENNMNASNSHFDMDEQFMKIYIEEPDKDVLEEFLPFWTFKYL
jgi:hypothetical protein